MTKNYHSCIDSSSYTFAIHSSRKLHYYKHPELQQIPTLYSIYQHNSQFSHFHTHESHFTLSVTGHSFHITHFSNPEELTPCITHFNKPAELISCAFTHFSNQAELTPCITHFSNQLELTPCITHFSNQAELTPRITHCHDSFAILRTLSIIYTHNFHFVHLHSVSTLLTLHTLSTALHFPIPQLLAVHVFHAMSQ
ncbi:hypothetical protein AVEN_181018-1 [Araneus ventricosus]|uniref:Uncharacterized protein n=1 Tax=Araneus ventricosus TaxID=182803 RepID=A0A4Y2QYH1_ARAVE|nr:hypothetical protein AVEN_69524-1 [Araneus ventricosus]GBN78288.1 hypothetical protein AVEN_181018-1 [Araneus ventricosus]